MHVVPATSVPDARQRHRLRARPRIVRHIQRRRVRNLGDRLKRDADRATAAGRERTRAIGSRREPEFRCTRARHRHAGNRQRGSASILERHGFGHAGVHSLIPETEADGIEAGPRIDHRRGQRDHLGIAWRLVHNAQGCGLRVVVRTRDKGNRNRAVTAPRQRLRALIDFHKFVGVASLNDRNEWTADANGGRSNIGHREVLGRDGSQIHRAEVVRRGRRHGERRNEVCGYALRPSHGDVR